MRGCQAGLQAGLQAGRKRHALPQPAARHTCPALPPHSHHHPPSPSNPPSRWHRGLHHVTLFAVAVSGSGEEAAADEALAAFHDLNVALFELGLTADLGTISDWQDLAESGQKKLDPPYRQEYVSPGVTAWRGAGREWRRVLAARVALLVAAHPCISRTPSHTLPVPTGPPRCTSRATCWRVRQTTCGRRCCITPPLQRGCA